MTFAAAAPTSTPPAVRETVSIAILGTDAVLAAFPATPVQLAHACLKAGFANVIPASWGDELIAAAVLRRLPQFGSGPVIQCSCPIVAHRLLTLGSDLRPALLPLVSPPVAVARYVRTLAKPAPARVTYIGACPGAVDESIDIRMTPEALITMLAERNILLDDQPRVFESVIPPDRRRFRSLPGGVPAPDALWSELGARTLVEVGDEDFVSEIAQHLLTGKNVLIDASDRLGCACAGAVNGARSARQRVAMLEPPRATAAVVDESPAIDLEMAVPAVTRTPVDVVAVAMPTPTSQPAVAPIPNAKPADVPSGPATHTSRPPAHDSRALRLSTPVVPRPVISGFPVARDLEGRALPRAYVARRRGAPRATSFGFPAEEPITTATAPEITVHVETPPSSTPALVTTPAEGAPVLSPATLAAIAPAPLAALAPVAAPTIAEREEPTSFDANTWYPSPSGSLPAAPAAQPPSVQNEVVPRAAEARPRGEAESIPAAQPSAPRGAMASSPPSEPATLRSRARPAPSEPRREGPGAGFSRGQRWVIVLAIVVVAVCASTVAVAFVARSMIESSAQSRASR